jgi:dinuclear metal center YbgI/SA1388 family protein
MTAANTTTVQDIYKYLDTVAPFSTQMKSDNGGVLIGDATAQIKHILVCLDATVAVVEEAVQQNAGLLIAHHPLMFFGTKKVLKGDPVFALIANNINFIAAHTNLDIAKGGITDLMLTHLGFPASDTVIGTLKAGDTEFGKITDLPSPITAVELARKCKSAFNCTVVRYVDGGKPVQRVGVCSGAGDDLAELAYTKGCDAYICGDIRNHTTIFAANHGLTLIDAGHFHTEDIFCEDLAARLKSAFPEITVEKAKNSKDVCSYVA